MSARRFYFSPQPNPQTTNQYISMFYESLSERVNVVNYKKRRTVLSVDLFRYALRSDVMILNWPEDMVHLRFGILQTFISMFILLVYRMTGGTIVWVCHNKASHNKQYKQLQKLTRSFFTGISQYIIVHSSDALRYFKNVKQKVHYINHPVYESEVRKTEKSQNRLTLNISNESLSD